MTQPVPPPGWHPDPADPGHSMRWWDGARWTEQTQPAFQGGFGAGPAAGGAPQWGAGGSTAGGWDGSTWGGSGDGGYGGGYGGPPPGGGFGSFGNRVRSGSFTQRSQASLTAIGVAILYIVVALTVHVVFFGIVPILAAVRAFRRREALAPLAAVAAGLSLVIAIIAISGR